MKKMKNLLVLGFKIKNKCKKIDIRSLLNTFEGLGTGNIGPV